MEIENIEKSIKEVLSNKLHIEEIKLEDNLKNDLGADSLDLVETIMDLESVFDIRISDNEAETIHTVKDAVEVVNAIVNKTRRIK